MGAESGDGSRRWGLDAARVLALLGALAVHGLWALSLAEAWGTAELERRDYRVFWDAGRRLLSGSLDGIYDARPGGFPFLHPPPVIGLSAPLGWLPPLGAYAVIVAVQLAALAVGLGVLSRLRPARRGELDVVALGVLASAPWGIALVLGQPSALLLASWLLGLGLWRDRPLAGGLALSVCVLKPPFLLAPLALALIARRGRVLAGIGLGVAVAFALSLPAGLARWPEWVAAASRAAGEVGSATVLLWKQHTWLAFLRGVTGSATLAWIGWAAVALPLGGAALWRAHDLERRDRLHAGPPRAGPPSADPPSAGPPSAGPPRAGLLRAGAALALATVALSPYAYFYDALLLALPAAALWLDRDRYPRPWRALLAVVAALTFATEHVAFFAVQSGPALGGALVTLWLAFEIASPMKSLRSPRSNG